MQAYTDDYYTPTIKEFVEGYKFQVRDLTAEQLLLLYTEGEKSLKLSDYGWRDEVFTYDMWYSVFQYVNMYDIYSTNNGNISFQDVVRTKLLCKEDLIEDGYTQHTEGVWKKAGVQLLLQESPCKRDPDGHRGYLFTIKDRVVKYRVRSIAGLQDLINNLGIFNKD